MRELASIREVDGISPIKGADKIELAHIGGWQCVVKKGEFTKGDRGLFFEIDSFLPASDSRFAFLGSPKVWGPKEGYRLRTIKLRGELSQGLLLPLDQFPDVLAAIQVTGTEDCDLAGFLGVVKWERALPAQLVGQARGSLPYFLRKTDQERIQNLSGKWEHLKRLTYEVTQKLDGSSMTVYHNNGETGVCSRNLELKVNEDNAGNAFVKVALREQLMEKLKQYGENLALQGELIGEGIQGNPEMLVGQQFYLYDVWDIDNQCHFSPAERIELARNLEVAHVPILFGLVNDYLSLDCMSVADVLKVAEGSSDLSDNKVREGLVFKSIDGKVSFKAISNAFLLKGGD